MAPFMAVGNYRGPVVTALNGVDLAFFIGIPVGCINYWLLCKNQDFSHERSITEVPETVLESVGKPIE